MSATKLHIPVSAAAFAALACGACERAPMPFDLTAAATQPVGEVALRFGWAGAGSAFVREEVQRGDKLATLGYTLTVRAEGDELAVIPSDVEMISLDGQRVVTEEDREAVESMRATMAAGLPPLRVSGDGKFVGIHDFESWQAEVDRAVTALAAGRGEGERRMLESALNLLRNPSNRQSLEQAAGDRWETWVGVWRGLRAAPGDTGNRKTRVFVPWAGAGAEVELPYRFPGFVVRPADQVRVEMSGEITPAQGGNLLTRAIASAALGDVSGMRARVTRLCVMDPATMLPIQAEFHRRLQQPAEGGVRESVEIRIWTFSWQTPTGSGG